MTDATVQPETSVVESLQSLIVAFVLAMTFRGFVTEGFVIPTGSMAPTLMGQHYLVHSEQTGYAFPIGVDEETRDSPHGYPDPMLGAGAVVADNQEHGRRMGDRILVLKSLYPFQKPQRFDVVVFKNPTDPTGRSANYIKRLIGLPDEQVLLIDGDVFVAPAGDDVTPADYAIQRKPEYVQRAVWQPVSNSDFIPRRPERLARRYRDPPWEGDQWDLSGRAYRCSTAGPSTLRWDTSRRRLTDWTSYNSRSGARAAVNVSDLRVRAAIRATEPAALETTFRIEVRDHVFEFRVRGGPDEGKGTADVRLRSIHDPDGWTGCEPHAVKLPRNGSVFDVEFWHVDQRLSMFINGRRVCEHEYDWDVNERLEATFDRSLAALERTRDHRDWEKLYPEPELTWAFEGSALTMERVRVDRDLFYRVGNIQQRSNPPREGYEELVRINSLAYGTHTSKPARLGPDHFMMLGDNSQASLDSRLWGSPHPLVAEQVDPSPFVVHRDLLIGKAWVVYFPAPFRLKDGGLPVVPDMGRLRFIR